jgi:hypothetical protein
MSMFDHTPTAILTQPRGARLPPDHVPEAKRHAHSRSSRFIRHQRGAESAQPMLTTATPPERRATFSPSGEAKRFEGEPRPATQCAHQRALAPKARDSRASPDLLRDVPTNEPGAKRTEMALNGPTPNVTPLLRNPAPEANHRAQTRATAAKPTRNRPSCAQNRSYVRDPHPQYPAPVNVILSAAQRSRTDLSQPPTHDGRASANHTNRRRPIS